MCVCVCVCGGGGGGGGGGGIQLVERGETGMLYQVCWQKGM